VATETGLAGETTGITAGALAAKLLRTARLLSGGVRLGSGANFIKCMFCRVRGFADFRPRAPRPKFPGRWWLCR
jgi:hypothetical protein